MISFFKGAFQRSNLSRNLHRNLQAKSISEGLRKVLMFKHAPLDDIKGSPAYLRVYLPPEASTRRSFSHGTGAPNWSSEELQETLRGSN